MMLTESIQVVVVFFFFSLACTTAVETHLPENIFHICIVKINAIATLQQYDGLIVEAVHFLQFGNQFFTVFLVQRHRN